MNTDQRTAAPDRIRLTTRFGEFDADASSLVTFPLGLPGFETCRQFVVLAPSNPSRLQCLHGVDGPSASFLAIDPRLALPAYRCIVSAPDALRLQVTDPSRLVWLALLTFGDGGRIFANLRAPVVINPDTMLGLQLMPHDTLYPLRHPVSIE